MLSRRKLYGEGRHDPAVTRSYGTLIHADKFGTDLAMRSAAPPSVDVYQQWLESRNVGQHAGYRKRKWTGSQVRRCVIMRRQGATWTECARAIGLAKGDTVRAVLDFLPLELQP